MKIKPKLLTVNFLFFVIGMFGVWQVSHNGWALFWTFIAALHVEFKSNY